MGGGWADTNKISSQLTKYTYNMVLLSWKLIVFTQKLLNYVDLEKYQNCKFAFKANVWLLLSTFLKLILSTNFIIIF